MSDLLKYKQKQITFEYIEGAGALADMGLSPDDIASFINRTGGYMAPDFKKRYEEFKAQFQEGDELWYIAKNEPLAGFGGYVILRENQVIASLRSWVA